MANNPDQSASDEALPPNPALRRLHRDLSWHLNEARHWNNPPGHPGFLRLLRRKPRRTTRMLVICGEVVQQIFWELEKRIGPSPSGAPTPVPTQASSAADPERVARLEQELEIMRRELYEVRSRLALLEATGIRSGTTQTDPGES